MNDKLYKEHIWKEVWTHNISQWPKEWVCYRINKKQWERYTWFILLQTNDNTYIVTDFKYKELQQITSYEFFIDLKKVEQDNYLLYYDCICQNHTGLILDCIIYTYKEREKIKSVTNY